MENELNILHNIRQVEPSDELRAKIWREVLRKRVETVSWYKVAIAACFLGGLLFSGIYVSTASKSSDEELVNMYQMSNSYDLYHE